MEELAARLQQLKPVASSSIERATRAEQALQSVILAVLKAKIKIKSALPPPDPGRNWPETHDFLGKLRTLPRDPPGEGGPRTKLENILSTARSWANLAGCGHGAAGATAAAADAALRPR